ncbi:hypothetical protein H4219_000823 [Mycoemilia scoparia]|uniref:Large ribosomal subunit protein bL21m n=1 Tax=Mycoemilia scoparia TaxID=417184 RepID=A0A9W8DSM7_9FUNG|nr:hypothetical protein H4219_000823 [Mycoemilia scoparia]
MTGPNNTITPLTTGNRYSLSKFSTASLPTLSTTNVTTEKSSQTLSPPLTTRTWSEETKNAINALRSENKYYATVVIKGRHFTVAENDVIVMDRMNDLELGDVLKLSQAIELGSKSFTLKGRPLIDPAFFSIEATVIEHPVGKQISIVKKRRHTGYKNTKLHQQRHTLLRVSKLDVNKLE